MGRLAFLLGTAFLLITSFASASHRDEHVCGVHVFNHRQLKYCIDFGDRVHNKDILFVLHGSGGTEQDWVQAPDNMNIENAWRERGVPSPTKITISFGKEWMLAEKVNSRESLSYQVMVNEVIPYMESKVGGEINHRFLKGVSMGGWNGVQLLLRNGELFDRVALVCPVIWTLGPYSTSQEVDEFLDKGKSYLDRKWVDELMQEFKELFPTQQEWVQHNPLDLIKTMPIKTPQVYLSCGDVDQYGFFDGTKEFAKLAAEKGIKVTWRPKHGGHCTIDSEELASFFAP